MSGRKQPLKVHLAFVGFEVQRITEPIIRLGGNRAYLFTTGPEDAAKDYWEQVHLVMTQYPATDIRDRYVDGWNLGAILRQYAAVIEAELAQGNEVYVNLSSGTKPAVMAGMLSAMIYGAGGYYARRYGNDVSRSVTKSTSGIVEAIENIDPIPILRIQPPIAYELKIVEALLPFPDGASKEALIRALIVNGGLDQSTDARATATYNRLNRWIKPMVEKGFLVVNGERKEARVQLTSAGRDVARIFVDPWRQDTSWLGPKEPKKKGRFSLT